MSTSPEIRFSSVIAALARPADLRALSMSALHLVMGIRVCALFDRAGRDPVAEMAVRFSSVTAAEQLLELIGMIKWCWPESFVVGRPCSLALTPDERTLANLARFAMSADRVGFTHEIDGFVRPGRQDALFVQTVRCVAELSAIQNRA